MTTSARMPEVLVEAGAAAMLLQSDVTEESLLGELVALLRDTPLRAAMSERARGLAKPGALQRIAEMVLRLAKSQNSSAGKNAGLSTTPNDETVWLRSR